MMRLSFYKFYGYFFLSLMVTLCCGVYVFLIYDMYKRNSGFGVLGDGLLFFGGLLFSLCLIRYFLYWLGWYVREVFHWYVNKRRRKRECTPLCKFRVRYEK